jgi:hypothetical protein
LAAYFIFKPPSLERMKPTIEPKYGNHKAQEVVFLRFGKDQGLVQADKSLGCTRWNTIKSYWCIIKDEFTTRYNKDLKDNLLHIFGKVIEMLRAYYKVYMPKYYLFEGQLEVTQYSEESLLKVLKNAFH